jgi:bis(5'-nucleosyl)-tetraphosphatase (symmetrical)
MATYAIGDIQGCYDPLRRLLDYISFDPSKDRLWLVGDLVNRGPSSLETLRFVCSLGKAATVVLGNHDLYLILQAEGYGKASKENTLEAILKATDRDELLAWLRSRPLFHVDGPWAMVHAGLLPQWTIEQAKTLSDEVSIALTARNYKKFLANMWGSEPAAWSDGLTGWDRLRVIVNAMTRMRYLRKGHEMEMRAPNNKAPPGFGPPGCIPWFDAPNRASADHTVICGHWSALGYRDMPGLVTLDTGCLWGGSLTAFRLEDRRVFRLPSPQYVKPYGWD